MGFETQPTLIFYDDRGDYEISLWDLKLSIVVYGYMAKFNYEISLWDLKQKIKEEASK